MDYHDPLKGRSATLPKGYRLMMREGDHDEPLTLPECNNRIEFNLGAGGKWVQAKRVLRY